MKQGATCKEWLELLDACSPADQAWRDPGFVQMISWVMILFMWRRMNQRLIDAGAAHELRPEYRDGRQTGKVKREAE